MTTPWEGTALSGARYSAAELSADGSALYLLDQLLLPSEERYVTLRDPAAVAEAIRAMVVRGAPAIGISAAYGMTLGAREAMGCDAAAYRAAMRLTGALLEAARPTAVNLSWAVARCVARCDAHAGEAGAERARDLAELARTIHREDVAACRAIGRIGAAQLGPATTVLTHCNAGALATGGYGTALGVIRAAAAAGKLAGVMACETRPYLQGARLTAWELAADGIDVTVISDGMAAHCMQRGRIGAVVVGADRIAQNGDVANKIGTYGLACLAHAHSIPFWVAAPWSTVDLATPDGDGIAIEQRPPEELSRLGDRVIIPAGVAVYNPAFDVTPARLIAGIITERGLFAPDALSTAAQPAAAR